MTGDKKMNIPTNVDKICFYLHKYMKRKICKHAISFKKQWGKNWDMNIIEYEKKGDKQEIKRTIPKEGPKLINL